MPSSPLSSVEAARAAVAARLQGLMKDAGLTGQELAVRCGWHKAKSSRIARGITPPSDADIRAWCAACGFEDQAVDIIAASRNAQSMYVEWKQIHRDGMRHIHEKTVPLYQRTRSFRVYASNVMPGMLQTAGYATGLLKAITAFQGTPDDVADAVRARQARSRVVREGDHRFAILLEETVLYYRVTDDAAMGEQLEYLLTVMGQPNVSLGVIPARARRTVWPLEAFYAFDDQQVAVETLTAEINLTTPGEIHTYLRAFSELSQAAVRGTPARDLIAKAITALE
ncbi:helix-turn-helix transcriptional regulator [Streptomyces sp. NBC_00091]|uniref:helix-turn-helix domain-containing protein n=1 Tax=Streptomyces sp. NBC_00091 TaxID=2975648 RepID=UPI00224E5794|nr:helix-turn-helix transcriptional regulator [Streptomyces sp. NBC_00091]MCX5377790.1 helix-turn-helix domain-containing protein [Streptomyces sp. NBC_00091]